MKNLRQQKIVELITKYNIDTHKMLIDKLKEEGIEATQTTLSRDINQLKIVKAANPKGGYMYVLPGTGRDNTSMPIIKSSLKEAVVKVESAMNIVVVKTLSGMANAVAVCVDALNHNEIVGSVAGDDTILLVVRDIETAKDVELRLLKNFDLKI